MKRHILAVVIILLIMLLCVACRKKAEKDNIALDNGVQVAVLEKYNTGDLEMDASKYAELETIEAYYKDKLSEDAWLFKNSASQISWCWGNPDAGDGIHDLVLTKNSDSEMYELDLNYDMRIDIKEDIGVTDSRDIVRFMLSLVTSEPTLVEEQIFMDMFLNEQSSIPEMGNWCNVADCDLQWNADNGYGLTIVIKAHAE